MISILLSLVILGSWEQPSVLTLTFEPVGDELRAASTPAIVTGIRDGKRVGRVVQPAVDGTIQIALEDGDKAVSIARPGYVTWRRNVSDAVAGEVWSVRLVKSVHVSGTVIDAETGMGVVAKGDISFVSNPKFMDVVGFRTDERGEFAVEVAPGPVTVTVSAAGFGTRSTTIRSTGGQPLKVALQPASPLAGRLITPGGRVTAGEVRLVPTKVKDVQIALAARVNDDGSFAIRDVAKDLVYDVFAKTEACPSTKLGTVDGSAVPRFLELSLKDCVEH